MSRSLQSSMEFKGQKLSDLFGKTTFLDYKNITHPVTKAESKKVTVFSSKFKDIFEVSVPNEIDLDTLKENDVIDFSNITLTIRANGRPGFNGGAPTGYLTTTIVAEDVIFADKMKTADKK